MPIARSCAARPAKRGGAGARLQACHSRPSPHARPPRTCGRTALRPPLCRERAAPRVRHISTPALAYGTPRAASVQAGCVILPAHTAPHHPPRPAPAGPSTAQSTRGDGSRHAMPIIPSCAPRRAQVRVALRSAASAVVVLRRACRSARARSTRVRPCATVARAAISVTPFVIETARVTSVNARGAPGYTLLYDSDYSIIITSCVINLLNIYLYIHSDACGIDADT